MCVAYIKDIVRCIDISSRINKIHSVIASAESGLSVAKYNSILTKILPYITIELLYKTNKVFDEGY